MFATEAWVLYQGAGIRNTADEPALLRQEVYSFASLQPGEALVEPIYGGWEANLSHAIERRPIDICFQRGEERVVIGNSGVVRVLQVGADVTHLHEGDLCVLLPHAVTDPYGYVIKVLAYDAPHTMGLLAKRAKFEARLLVPLPKDTRYSLRQWASMARYLSAWSNWQVAYACLRSQLPETALPAPYVWAWGGGVSFAELQLAQHYGCQTAMIASTPRRLDLLARSKITPINRGMFRQLTYDEQAFEASPNAREQYLEAENTFLQLVHSYTQGEGVHIFIDNIGTPVYRATLRALARQGVITTCGWKHGMVVSHLRAVECISRHIHVYSHAMTYDEALAALSFAEEHGWLPDESECPLYTWDDVPRLAQEYGQGSVDAYFPLFAVNPA